MEDTRLDASRTDCSGKDGFALLFDRPIFDNQIAAFAEPELAQLIEHGRIARTNTAVEAGIFRPWTDDADTQFLRVLRPRHEWPRGHRTAQQSDESASSPVEHGLSFGTRCASLPRGQDRLKARAGPWGRSELS
jgi:hypothetical protein